MIHSECIIILQPQVVLAIVIHTMSAKIASKIANTTQVGILYITNFYIVTLSMLC